MSKIEIEIPRNLIDKIDEKTLVEGIKSYLSEKYSFPDWKVSISGKRAPSLRLRDRKAVGEWKIID